MESGGRPEAEPHASQHPDDVRRAKVVSAAGLITGACLAGVGVLHFARGGLVAGTISLSTAAICLGLAALDRHLTLDLRANLLVAIQWLVMTLSVLMRGGLGTPPAMALAALPMIALLLVPRRAALAWAAVVTGSYAFFVVLHQLGLVTTDLVSEPRRHFTNAAAGLAFLGLLFGIGLEYERRKATALRRIAERDEQLRAAERARNDAEAEARVMRAEHLASLGQLAAGAAHEINNPLAYVLANLSSLGKRQERGQRLDDAESREALHDALLGAKYIQRIVADLKTYSRADEEELSAVDVHVVVEDTIKMARNELRHRARVERDIEAGLHVEANRARLGQILLNLLINAAQAIPDGAADKNRITVWARRDGDDVVVEVRDTGVGIPADILSRVTEPFFTTKPIGVGTGLGLSACVNLTKRLGGRFELASVAGSGTTARLLLRAAEAPVADPVSTESYTPEAANSARARVLVVDDDAMVARALRRILSAHQVEMAASGAEALRLLARETAYDLILCDMMMPEMTGEQFHARLRTEHPALAERVAFISGGAFSVEARAFLASWEGPVIGKPFAERELHDLVAAALAGREAAGSEAVSVRRR